jgi:hypothetical protein
MNEQVKTDRLGVSKLDHFFSSNGWLFREQFLHDYGIDAQVEIVKDGKPTGDLIAIQIKSGLSYFSESTDTSFVYHTDNKHIGYWIKHCLPVIVVLYNPNEDILYWENVSDNSITSTGQGWRITIPKNKYLTNESLSELCKLTQPPPYIQKLNRLRLDKTWIELVAEGETVYIEFEDWINKSLPRFTIRIGCETRSGIEEQAWPTIYGIGLSLEEAISYVIPWAEFEVDEDAYHDFMESQWYAECYMGRDKDDDSEHFSEPFEEWYKPPEGIVPVSEGGEVERYRLILSLNQIGKAFLDLDEFLAEEDHFQDRTFSLEL